VLRVNVREEQQPANLVDVRKEVERDLRYSRDQAARDAIYARLRTRYRVRIEKPEQGASDAALAAEPQ